ncbi:peptidase S1 and S6, chymotrypsin/Hap [Tribonema minus]|uniref:Peptidase S1 and S6, chymotrypsin/Hap n=1 Tax=Tribonema minus TaxID=303371 RepID=A0A835YLV2_9STRA|nr:peptidase S1 and S6, chymotrypsin/Hap [Tribonema minus]
MVCAFSVRALCLALVAAWAMGEKKDGVYAHQPKLRVQGEELPADAAAVALTFLPKLEAGTDYKLSVQSTALVMELVEGRAWVEMEEGAGGQPLYLTSAKLNDVEILGNGIQVATVYPTPDVEASDALVYTTTPPNLIVNGTNFNIKHTALFFDPPLQDGVDISTQVVSPTQILLVKRYGKMWRSEGPGPLKLVAIDTGGGRLPLDPDTKGRIIAEVQADREGHGVTVETHVEKHIYQSTPTLEIDGVGFNPDGTQLRFANGLRGGGANYTASTVTPTRMTLDLAPGSKWRGNVDNLPGALVLLAADAGAGFVALGATAVKSGRKVATVYEDPSVKASEVEIFRTHTHTLSIQGAGFNDEFSPVFKFEGDHLQPRKDYYVNVVNRTHVDLMLTTDDAWAPAAGPLKVVSVDTGAGPVALEPPVTVAEVVDDTAEHPSGVTVTPSNTQVIYQSDASREINIAGTGFNSHPTLVFDPPLKAGTNYTVVAAVDTMITLRLQPGKKWREAAGPLMLMSIGAGAGPVPLGGSKGIKVAFILADPTVKEENLRIYATHSKHFKFSGSGFLQQFNPYLKPIVELAGVPADVFKVDSNWTPTSIQLLLNEGKSWAKLSGAETASLKVSKIDTGAGLVTLPNGGVHVVTVHADSNEVICEDTCVYPADGTCDEPSAKTGGVLGTNHGKWGYSDDDANFHSAGYSSSYAGQHGYLASSYGSDDLGFGIAPCDPGTDCTDCGVHLPDDGFCTNTCLKMARDGWCDDTRGGGTCLLGTDCQDCGPVGHDNFTNGAWGAGSAYGSGENWYTDDSSNFLLDDDWALEGQAANAKPIYQRTFQDHESRHNEMEGEGGIFMDVLWAIVILVGGTVSLGFCMVAYRRLKSGDTNFVPLPVGAGAGGERGDEMEMARLREADVTPDVVRIG